MQLNNNEDIDGFIVQLPLPDSIQSKKLLKVLIPQRFDGFHPVNIGRMVLGLPSFVSATPAGILELIRRYEIPTSGKSCTVIGRSNIVGKPISILMSQKSDPGDATVTLCHSRTQNLKEIMRSSDIIIAALGKPEFVKADMVKEGAVVFDVGSLVSGQN